MSIEGEGIEKIARSSGISILRLQRAIAQGDAPSELLGIPVREVTVNEVGEIVLRVMPPSVVYDPDYLPYAPPLQPLETSGVVPVDLTLGYIV